MTVSYETILLPSRPANTNARSCRPRGAADVVADLGESRALPIAIACAMDENCSVQDLARADTAAGRRARERLWVLLDSVGFSSGRLAALFDVPRPLVLSVLSRLPSEIAR